MKWWRFPWVSVSLQGSLISSRRETYIFFLSIIMFQVPLFKGFKDIIILFHCSQLPCKADGICFLKKWKHKHFSAPCSIYNVVEERISQTMLTLKFRMPRLRGCLAGFLFWIGTLLPRSQCGTSLHLSWGLSPQPDPSSAPAYSLDEVRWRVNTYPTLKIPCSSFPLILLSQGRFLTLPACWTLFILQLKGDTTSSLKPALPPFPRSYSMSSIPEMYFCHAVLQFI